MFSQGPSGFYCTHKDNFKINNNNKRSRSSHFFITFTVIIKAMFKSKVSLNYMLELYVPRVRAMKTQCFTFTSNSSQSTIH